MAQVDLKEIQRITNHPSYTEDQKEQMLARLMAGLPAQEEYQRQTSVAPVEEKPEGQEPSVNAFKPDWLPEYHKRFQATFIQFEGQDTFPLADGKKEARIRKLVLGDYMKLAALVPKWKNHLLGDEPLNPFLIDEASGQTLNPVKALTLLVTRATEEWDFDRNQPTGFALSFLTTVREFLGNPDKIEINDFLNSEPEEVVNLIIGIYVRNIGFFTKITAKFGIISDIKTVFLTLYSGLKKILKESADRLSGDNSDSDSQKESTTNQSLTDGNGNPSGGGKIPSLHRSAKARKGS